VAYASAAYYFLTPFTNIASVSIKVSVLYHLNCTTDFSIVRMMQ